MRKSLLIICLVLLPLLAGCSMSDMLFTAFGDYYSAGGDSREEKYYDYSRRVEAAGVTD